MGRVEAGRLFKNQATSDLAKRSCYVSRESRQQSKSGLSQPADGNASTIIANHFEHLKGALRWLAE